MKRYLLLVLFCLSACAPITPQATQTQYPTLTPYPTYTPLPTYTIIPTLTPLPPTSFPALTQTKDIYAVSQNHLYINELKGVYFELLRIVIKDKEFEDMSQGFDGATWKEANSFIMFEYLVKNNSDKKVSLLFKQTTQVSVGNEQVDGGDYVWNSGYFGDDPQSDVMPGVTIQGGFWLPLKTKRSEMNKVYVVFDPPFMQSTALSPEINFSFDVSDWQFEPRP